ncbi:MAG: S8 family serine peptidase [Candidatus Rokubacteria bacterium]|nr:S8 family serine peptidase [Candidatus Rokubacteria bacterium]
MTERRGALVALALAVPLIVARPASGEDPLVSSQWHLESRGVEPAGANVKAAWPTTGGAGVVIGVVDDGLQHTHPDLEPNYDAALSFDFNGNDADPMPSTSGICDITANCHGTAASGVAAARGENGHGVSGAAPFASLAGLRLIAAPVSDDQEADALSHEVDAIHIASNSWGPSDDGRTLAGPGPLAQAAIETAATTGRAGKGRIYSWAAGNGLQSADNCNFDGYANSRFVIAVAALADTAQQAPYSEPCSAMFVTAPSSGGTRSITTTDLVGSQGYSSTGDYTNTFGGTSSAAPLLSGVVALVLAENPSLTWRDVKHLLARSSVRINPTDTGWTTGALPHNENFGFGLVDAAAAVALAATWTNVPPEGAIPPVTRTPNLGIPDNNATGVADTVTIGSEFAGFSVEHVEVVFDATHPFRGELEVTLTSPSGVASRLATVRPLDSGDNFAAWRFGSVRHWGESPAGVWTLRVADRNAQDLGTWNSWTLRIFGTATAVSTTTLAVTKAGFGSGTVTSDPMGIDCGSDCFEAYTSGTMVTLTAAPAAGATFAGWSGACTGSGPCTVMVNAALSVTATFEGVAATRASDFDGDGRADVAIWRPGTGQWWTIQSSTGLAQFVQWGVPGDVPVPGDYDGDGRADPAIWRPGTGQWWILQSSTGLARLVQWGVAGDIPVPGDYDGDGRVDVAIWRPGTGQWWILQSSTGLARLVQWGFSGDLPAPGDYDGDGRTDITIFRPRGEWWVLQSTTGLAQVVQWGMPGDVPVPGDYDGDGTTDITIFRPTTGEWWTIASSTGLAELVQWGLPDDVPLPLLPSLIE